MHLRYTPAIDVTGDGIVTAADTMMQIGAEMYSYLRNLITSGLLDGPGIARGLDESQGNWNAACVEFSQCERDYGLTTKDAYMNMMAADRRGGGYF